MSECRTSDGKPKVRFPTPADALRIVAQHRTAKARLDAIFPVDGGGDSEFEVAAYTLADSVQALTAEVAMLRADRARLADRLREQGQRERRRMRKARKEAA